MATSGSTNFTMTAAQIVQDSLILLGVSHPEEVVSASTQNWAIRQFNKMIKAMGSQGANLWALEQATCLVDNDVRAYTFHDKSGTGGTVGAGVKESGLAQTTFSADEASGQTILSVTSSAGMSASDQVLIELDDGSRDDTTIVSVDSSTQITVTAALSSAASEDNYIYAYTAATDEIKHPEQIMNVRLRENGGNEIPMRTYSREEYMRLVDKDTEGRPYVYFYDKQLTNRVLYLYPEPNSIQVRIMFDYLKTLDDIDATTDNLHFPDEWLEALTYNLAVRLAPAYGKVSKLQIIVPLAQDFLDEAMSADDEEVSINFKPEMF